MAQELKFKTGELAKVIANSNNHQFDIGEEVVVERLYQNGEDNVNGFTVYICYHKDMSDYWYVKESDLESINNTQTMVNQLMKAALLVVANDLLKANNTVTTLEIKTELRKRNPEFYWDQATVSKMMDELAQANTYIYTDNGVYRIYSQSANQTAPYIPVAQTVTPTTAKISAKVRATRTKVTSAGSKITRKQALELMKNNKGHFFTATFVKKDGSTRVMNCQYLKDQSNSDLGYVKVKEAAKMKTSPSDCTRQINLQTLQSLTIGGQVHKIK